MSDEITRVVATAERMLKGGDPDPQTAITDAIASLLILAHERRLEVANAWYNGAAHYAATYLEPLSDEDAADWMDDHLFPFNGEHSADVYIARDALVKAGKSTGLAPEFGV